MNKKIILALTGLAVSLIGCNSGSSSSDNGGGSGGTQIGNYTMSVYSTGSSFSGSANACTRITGGFLCDKTKSSKIEVAYSLKGSPNFYVEVMDPYAGITIEETPSDYTDEGVSINGACNNIKSLESATYSCTTTLTYTAGALSEDSADVKFKIKGQAGEDDLFIVKYK